MSDESTLRAMPEYEGEEAVVERVLAELATRRAQMTDMAKLLGEGRVEIVRLRDLVALNGREVLRLRAALEDIVRADDISNGASWEDAFGEVVDIARNALKETT